jgi:hypothetical protein
MNEVAPQLPWLESDEWLDERGQETPDVGSRNGLPELGAAPHVTERRAARAGRSRAGLTGYARLALLIMLVTEIAWCAYLASLAIALL